MLLDFDRYSVVRGHCLARLRALANDSIDTFITDPPYGIALQLGTHKRKNDRSIVGDGRLEAQMLWRDVVPEMARAAKPDSAHLVFGTWKSPWMVEVLAQHFTLRGCIAWDKKHIGLGHYLRPRWEMIYFITKGRPKRYAMPAPADVWTCTRVHKTRHPCEKPVALLRRCVELVSTPGDVVADPFAGICSTGVAALELGRRFLGMEIDTRFATLGEERCRQAAAMV